MIDSRGPDQLAFISVIIPCYNEERFIGKCLDSIVANTYCKDRLEIIIVDGMSTDNTREIVAEFCHKYPFIRMIDNPDKIKPRALNIGIREAKGDIIIRMDAHAIYEPEYISKSVRYLDEWGADNVGGIRKTLAGNDSLSARAIAYAVSHPFAVGNATYRTGASKMKWVDTVFGGCYRRRIFDEIGFFNESLIRGQDREFNVRLKRAGGKILLAPDIICHYFARSDLRSYTKWIFVGGLTPFYISKITRNIIFSWRNLVPLLFVASLFALFLLSVWNFAFFWLFLATILFYLAVATFISIPIARRERDIRFLAIMPLVFAATHVAYGLGSIVGLFKPVKHGSEWSQV
ncbi:TPA: glycosyltransferase family 2 protein [Candidatus Poribacteria bacterium]|nr:glycosyltransferase family 2 protein [Candidatus Poribacteria bacterium]